MRMAALTLRAVPRLALRMPRRMRRLTTAAMIAAAALSFLYYGWFRDSSLVQVRDVSVVGLTGPESARVRERLKAAGLGMTTLHVRTGDLRRAVSSEPSIRSLTAKPDFPHGLRIDVTENRPVGAIAIPGSGRVPIAGNGTLMPGDSDNAPVPELRVPGATRVSRDGTSTARLADDRAAPLVRVAAAAPPALLQRAATIERRRGEGIVVVLREGPRLMFGDTSRLADKWRAAAGVLASRDSRGASYVDLRLADRPVAGGLTAPAPPSTPAGGSAPQSAPAGTAVPAPAPPQAVPVTPQPPIAEPQP